MQKKIVTVTVEKKYFQSLGTALQLSSNIRGRQAKMPRARAIQVMSLDSNRQCPFLLVRECLPGWFVLLFFRTKSVTRGGCGLFPRTGLVISYSDEKQVFLNTRKAKALSQGLRLKKQGKFFRPPRHS